MTIELTELPTGLQLKLARIATNMSRGEVCNIIGYGVSNLANLEDGRTTPHLGSLKKLVSLYREKGVQFGVGGWVRLKEMADPKD